VKLFDLIFPSDFLAFFRLFASLVVARDTWQLVRGNDSIHVAQRIGGASVWRELRRLKEKFGDSILEQAIIAADNNDWKGFTNAMGGIFIP